ncbi:MAG: glycosyltransferase family 39 protein [Patescibacteria group bacterium]
MKPPFLKEIKFSKSINILTILSVVFLIFQFSVITPIKVENGVGLKFDWPDEVANYFWAKELVANHRLSIPESFNVIAENQIHPRSFNTTALGALVPGSFLGLIILFAFLATIFGTGAIIYFTPILMLGGAWAFYFLIKKVFNSENVALLSAVLLLISAPWQYYSFESLLPNVPFVSLLIISVALLVSAKKNQYWLWLLSGFTAGLALAIRPSELVWAAVAYLVLLIAKKNELSLLNFVVIFAGGLVALLPSIFFQYKIYGSLFVSGYDKLPDLAVQSSIFLKLLKQAVIPFGLHPYLALHNFWNYFVLISPVTALLSFSGFLLYLKKWREQTINSKIYFWLTLFIFFWLFNYYGSWQFEDLRTLSLNRLGASYVRYWLILFALSLPFVGLLIDEISRRWKLKYFSLAAVIILGILSIRQIIFSDPNNILAVRRKVADNRTVAAQLVKDIPNNAIIITNRSDKIFFPERRVIETFGLKGDLNTILPNLKKLAPLYIHEGGILKPL